MDSAIPTLILGIETSCDETAAAVVADGRFVRSNVVASQVALHAPHGGVFPELASRQHIRDIAPVIQQAVLDAGMHWSDLAAIAVTQGPGLPGSLLVGVNAAKGLSIARGLPLVAVNHLEGHLYSNWLHSGGQLRESTVLADDPPFPHLALIVSGGHTDLVYVRGHGDYVVLGKTLDDAAGEAFDKAARMLGLGYPGGPAVELAALAGDPNALRFPVAETNSPLDFSFSGLKTAVLRVVERWEPAGESIDAGRASRALFVEGGLPSVEDDLTATSPGSARPVADVAASFQAAVVRALVGRVQRALDGREVRAVLVSGGVSANGSLRQGMAKAIEVPLYFPPLVLCTDNAAMIAAAGFWTLQRGEIAGLAFDIEPNLGLQHSGE